MSDAVSARWHEQMACSGETQPLWDYTIDPPHAEQSEDRALRLRAARRICRSCPVQSECLRAALEMQKAHPPTNGMWGGVLFNENGEVEALPKRPRKLPPLPEPVLSTSTSESKTVALEASRDHRITVHADRTGHATT